MAGWKIISCYRKFRRKVLCTNKITNLNPPCSVKNTDVLIISTFLIERILYKGYLYSKRGKLILNSFCGVGDKHPSPQEFRPRGHRIDSNSRRIFWQFQLKIFLGILLFFLLRRYFTLEMEIIAIGWFFLLVENFSNEIVYQLLFFTK